MLNKMDKILVIGTFIMGIITGVFLFVTIFKPNYIPELIDRETRLAQEFSIVGRAIQNDYTIATFQVLSDRSYVYVPPEETVPIRGKLPRELYEVIVQDVQAGELYTASGIINLGRCESESEATRFSYDITADQSRYALDTCLSSTAQELRLEETLKLVWEYVGDPSGYVGDDTPLLQRWLQKQLSVEQE